jgi:hypothetical protein
MRSSATTVLGLSDATWSALTAAYQVEAAAEVRAYLGEHPDAPDLLLEIREAVRPYFGDDPMSLAVFVDPEADEAEEELIAAIRTHRDGEDALERLTRFNREWWLPRRTATRVPVLVTIYLV